MNILKQAEGKINGVLETFDRMIINGYLRPLQCPRLFLFYLIQNQILLKNFNEFAEKQTAELCDHVEQFVKSNECEIKY